MGQKNSTQKGANKFQPSVEAKGKHIGTFQSGLDNKKLKVSEILVGGDRGSGHIDTQLGLSREPVVRRKQTGTPNPEQRQQDYLARNFANPYIREESESGEKACVVGITYDYDTAIGMYPPDARIVAPLREACVDFTHLLVPEQNIMIHNAHEGNSQYSGFERNGALLQDKPIIQCFTQNMEPGVPFELVSMENQ